MRDYLCVGAGQEEVGQEEVGQEAGQEVARLVLAMCEQDTSWHFKEDTSQMVYRSDKIHCIPSPKRNATCCSSGLCLSLETAAPPRLVLSPCLPGNPAQEWRFTHHNPGGLQYSDLA